MYSFDVFDTLITRTSATPKGIFALMQDKLLKDKRYDTIPEYIKKNFFELRVHSEELARVHYTNRRCEDITLEQIYSALSMTGCLSDEEINLLMRLEKDTEYENIIGIPENIEKVKKLVRGGEHVILISDMYLDSNTIRNMLIKVDKVFEHIPLYVSCEYNATKGNGTLYQKIKNMETYDNKKWIHCGDDIYADVKAAERCKITTEHYKYENLLPCEKAALENKEDDSFIQLMIGTARNARLFNKATGKTAIGISIGGPIIFPYVWWVISESLKKGIKRLYFIARDGYILKKVADIIIERFNYDIDTYYIYGSRKAWRMPSFSIENNDIFEIISWSHPHLINNIELLAEVFKISPHEMAKFVPDNYKNRNFTLYELHSLANELNNNKEFKDYLINHYKEERQRVVEYLKQEINTDDDNFAFVELSGSGYTQECLANIMSDFYCNPIKTFYFKVDRLHKNEKCIFFDFMPSFLYINYIIEVLYRAPYGHTVGYIKEKDEIKPKIIDDEGSILLNYGINDYINGIEKFTKEYIETICRSDIDPASLKLILRYMEYITRTPDREILDFVSDMPFSDSGREKKVSKFAPKLTRKDIFNIFLLRLNEPVNKYYFGSNLDYSVLRCNDKDKRLIDFCKRHNRKLLGRIARFIKRKNNDIMHDYPLHMLKGDIVLYGAGKYGHAFYKKLKKQKDCKIVQWVDAAYKEMGRKISSIDDIGKVNYDFILITVKNKNVATEIKNMLIERGIPSEKIIWFDLYIQWL